MVRPAELKKILRFGLFGAVGCLAGWLVGEPFLALALPAATAGGAPSLVSRADAPAAPPAFKERLDAAKAQTGDVQISLIWNNAHDLDLHCFDTQGEEIFFNHKRSRTGGWLDVDSNAACEQDVRDKPVENIFWAKDAAPDGTYRVFVHFYTNCPKVQLTDPGKREFETAFDVRVLAGGEQQLHSGTVRFSPDQRDRYKAVCEFTLGPKVQIEAPAAAEVRGRSALKLPFRVTRVRSPGPVTVTAGNLPAGVTAAAVTLPDGVTDGVIELASGSGVTPGTTDIELTAAAGGRVGKTAVAVTTAEGGGWSWRLIFVIGTWTALLAAGLVAALVAAQNLYLGRQWHAGGLPVAAAGGAAAGAASGAVGQALLFVFAYVSLASAGFLAGWLLLGALLGRGVSYFIPNLDAKKATLAGLAGGGLGAVAFLIASLAADWPGRVVGAAILGFCIGLMVALVEVAFRRAWLEVKFGGGEVITVNLGPEPVKVGGDSKQCAVWARGAAPVALRYWVRDGKVVCHDVPGNAERDAPTGDTRQVGAIQVTVHTGAGVAGTAAPAAAPPPPESHSPPPVPPAAIPPPIVVRPVAARPAVIVVPPPAAPPKPPPPPPPKPAAATPLKQPAPPKPPAGGADACPVCGRKVTGTPGKRYCIVDDVEF